MSTGATDEQIEAAAQASKRALLRDADVDGPIEDQRVLIGLAACFLVPPDHRIIRADENHLTPETKAALTNILRFVDGIVIVGGGHEQIQRDWDVLSSAIGGQT